MTGNFLELVERISACQFTILRPAKEQFRQTFPNVTVFSKIPSVCAVYWVLVSKGRHHVRRKSPGKINPGLSRRKNGIWYFYGNKWRNQNQGYVC